MIPHPNCIVCGKEIAKNMRNLSFIPATLNDRENGERSGTHFITVFLDLELRPSTKEEAQRYINHEILRVRMSQGRVSEITWWEGEFKDSHFHSERCAAIHGRRAAKAGFC